MTKELCGHERGLKMPIAKDNAFDTRRRSVKLHSFEELAGEIDRVHAMAVAGRVRAVGNWTTAQVFLHLARFIQFSLDGFPFVYPWPTRWLARFVGWLSWRWLLRVALPSRL
jgi:hypothetical protein